MSGTQDQLGTGIGPRIRATIAQYTDQPPESILPHMTLVDDLNMDSLTLLAVATALNQEFDIEIPDDIISEISTVGDLSKWISARVKVQV